LLNILTDSQSQREQQPDTPLVQKVINPNSVSELVGGHAKCGGIIMKRTLTLSALFVASAMPALAADLPVQAPPPAVMAAVWNWNGFYIGLNGGYSWGRSSRDLNFFNPLNGVVIATGTGAGRDLNGGVFGGQVGYNW